MTKEKIRKDIELPENTEASFSQGVLKIKGPKGTAERMLKSKKVSVKVEGKKITIEADNNTKHEKRLLNTFRAHIRNTIKGATEGHTYRMKICAGHFPMNVSASKNELTVKNFLGEKVPRKIKIPQGVNVKIEGNEITIESTDLELAGRTASMIEEKTKRRGFDKRVFQDGIFITEKNGKPIK